MKTLALPIVALIALTVHISSHREAPVPNALWTGEKVTLPSPTPSPGLEGYCWPLSAAPRETIVFYASGRGSREVRFLRHWADASGLASILMGTTTFVPAVQATNDEAYRNGAGWAPSFRKTIPENWPSGIYSAELTDLGGNKSHVVFIVKPASSWECPRTKVAVIANVNTWLAYNGWGGGSKYDGAARVSFMRPNPETSPVTGAPHLTRGELWILGYLENEGYQPDVYTDLDFHNGLPGGYTHLVLSTHPEYWTLQMYSDLKAFLNAGGSLLYLGGNGIYEEAEYELRGANKGMVFRAGVDRPMVEPGDIGGREVALFRMLRPPKPERTILGVATERCAVEGGPYEVLNAAHPLLLGTGLRNGEIIGNSGLNIGYGNGKAAAWEIDTSNGVGATGIPTGCNETLPSVPPGPGLPAGLTILARGQNWREGKVWKGAEMVYYRHPGGGSVFSVGSITFGGSLIVDPMLQQIVRNALPPLPRILRDVELGREHGMPWRLVSTTVSGERLYRIELRGLVAREDACPVDWYKIISLPPYFHDPEGRDACNPQLRIVFPFGVKITRVREGADHTYLDLESFRASPLRLAQIFFSEDELAFRVEPLRRTYNLTFEFLAPSEGLCRIPTRP
jgi:hypothetical protein